MQIVVGIDGSRGARQALQRAVETFPAAMPLILVNVIDVNAFPAEHRAQSRLLASTLQRLQEAGVEASTRAEQGDAAEVLMRIARELAASTLVVGSRGAYVYVAGRDDEDRLGSVACAVKENAKCEVLIVKECVGS